MFSVLSPVDPNSARAPLARSSRQTAHAIARPALPSLFVPSESQAQMSMPLDTAKRPTCAEQTFLCASASK